MKVNCEYCNKEIERRQSQIDRAAHTTCSKECAGKLQSNLSKEVRECLHCGEAFEVKKGDPKKFCGHSCSASYNNVRKESKYSGKVCLHCQKEYSSANPKFCTHKCSADYKAKQIMNDYTTTWTVAPTSKLPKKYIINTKGYKCEVCGITEWQGNPIALQLDHIDGNAYNNHEDNLRLLCPNCHSQTDTFGGKNRGNGRLYRREYRKKNYTDKGIPQL